MKEPPLKISNLTVNYEKTAALWDLTLEVPSGKLVAIVGPNGAGKSTLLKAILGVLKPLSGTIEFFGEPLSKMRKKIAYVPQKESVDWDFPMTLYNLVLMGSYQRLGLFRLPSKKEKEKAFHYLKLVGLENLASKQISELSGGQQQRAFMARALFQEADLYFMDEPFSGVDIVSSKVIHDILIDLKKQGKTVCVVHHDLETVVTTYDWVVLLNMRLIGAGEVSDVFTPELIHKTFGQECLLLDRVAKLTSKKMRGES